MELGLKNNNTQQSFSYKHFMETTIPAHLPPWPAEMLKRIDDYITEYAATQRHRIEASLDPSQLKKDIQEEIICGMKLRSFNHPFKRVQDKIRHRLGSEMQKYYSGCKAVKTAAASNATSCYLIQKEEKRDLTDFQKLELGLYEGGEPEVSLLELVQLAVQEMCK